MPIQFGDERVSDVQRDLLRQFKFGEVPTELAGHYFQRVTEDEDIVSGRETLDRSWFDLYDKYRDRLQKQLSPKVFETFDEIFNSNPVDADVAQINPSALRITFLLGAGASKPEPSGIPVTRELLSHLFMRAQRANRDEVMRVADFCKDNSIDNIEDLLTAAQIATFCSRSPTILKLLDYLLYRNLGDNAERRGRRPEVSSIALLQDTFQLLFGSLSGIMLPAKPNPCHEAVAKFASDHAGCAIITTNYDCCMDRALGKPGEAFSYLIPFANHPELDTHRQSITRLIKLHGSLNWFYCETCQQVQFIDIIRAVTDFEKDEAPFPVIGICSKCSGQRRGLAVPPLAMKFDFFPPLTPLLAHAQDAFEAADLIVAIGYSFADADLYISRMISKSMQAKATQRLMIVDSTRAVAQRIRRKLDLTVPSFDPARVLAATGDCAQMVPRFLKGELRGAAATTTRNKVTVHVATKVKTVRRKAQRSPG